LSKYVNLCYSVAHCVVACSCRLLNCCFGERERERERERGRGREGERERERKIGRENVIEKEIER
jgi:hypothetical protein